MRQVLLAALICSSLAFPVLARGAVHSGGGARGGASAGFRGGGARGGARGGGARGGGFHSGGFRNGGFTHRTGFRTGFGFQRFPRVYPFFYGGYGYYDPYWYSS